MKNLAIIWNLLLAAALAAWRIVANAAPGVESQRDWTERFELESDAPRLEIRNIWGEVRVQTGPAGEITMAISERRSAPDQERYDRSLEVYGLEIESGSDSVVVRVGHEGQGWHRRDPCKRCRAEYQFEVRVPSETRLRVKHEEFNGRHRYRIEQFAGLRLAGGRPVFSISSLNGDFRIQETR